MGTKNSVILFPRPTTYFLTVGLHTCNFHLAYSVLCNIRVFCDIVLQYPFINHNAI